MAAWWLGTRLVAGRVIREDLRSKTLWIVTAGLLLLSIAAVVVPHLIARDEASFTLATIGEAPSELVAAVDDAARLAEVEVEYIAEADEAAVRQTIEDGAADVGLAGDTMFTGEDTDATFPVLVSQAVVILEVTDRLREAGLTPEQTADALAVQPPQQVVVGDVEDADRAGVGFVVGIVLYLAVTFAGSAIATAVAMEKSTHISEVLLAILRPTQVLAGTVFAVGLVALGQLLVLAAPAVIAMRVSDSTGVPAAVGGDIALGIVWFVLGFLLYSFVFAAAGALVDKMSEVGTTTMPIQLVLLVSYMIGLVSASENSEGAVSVVASIFPLTAPMVMPFRWAAGETPVWQLVLAFALTAATALGVALVAASAYRRALLITGRRARLREVIGAHHLTGEVGSSGSVVSDRAAG
jgi:ABC-2 type transport system permease protein